MSTSIELKEQIKLLKYQQQQKDKELNKMKKEFKLWKELMNQHTSFVYANNWKGKYTSFEALIIDQKWKNSGMNRNEFEFLFSELGYTDTEFFTTFLQWEPIMFNTPIEDRKCCVCISYYCATKSSYKFRNCSHKICAECYTQLRKKGDGFKCCVICRESEKPK